MYFASEGNVGGLFGRLLEIFWGLLGHRWEILELVVVRWTAFGWYWGVL